MYDKVKQPRETNTYEVTYWNGKKEYVNACQTSWSGLSLSGGSSTIRFHGEPNGEWTLLLSVSEDYLKSVRNLSQLEPDYDFEELTSAYLGEKV